MARKRMIDPSFWVDEKLGTIDPHARLLFMGLISQSDDEGRLNGHPALIRSLIFPYDHQISVDDVEEWLTLLAADERKLIIRYEVDYQKYIWIPNFKKHQTINKPQKSKLPEYYGNTTVVEGEDYVPKEEKGIEVKGIRSEEKGIAPSPDIKDSISNLLKQCNIQNYTLYSIDVLASYHGVVEIEVIEAAIKKAQDKHVNYAENTLKGWIKDGKTTKESLIPKVPSGGNRARSTNKPKLEVYKADSADLTPEEKAELDNLVKYLEGA